LIDTNTISEEIKKSPNKTVSDFIRTYPRNLSYLSVITLGEIQKGIEKVENLIRKERLVSWFSRVQTDYQGHILDIDKATMMSWAKMVAAVRNPLPMLDSLLAATCLARGLTLVTRNVRDFAPIPGLSVVNPWEPT
jgi:predicted nucleic acid-binding protein